MTVKDLWYATTTDIYIHREGGKPLKLPACEQLPMGLGSREIYFISIHKRFFDSPYLLVRVRDDLTIL